MERISLFNYEAFYLDFLEGKLNEEDTALLFAFLEKYPELKLDDEDPISLDPEYANLNSNFKNSLKQFDEEETIVPDNVEQFLIAELEGQLNKEKQVELSHLVASNNTIEKERNLYQLVRFQPDTSIIYSEKELLKQKTLVLWPYIAGVAAVGLVAFFLLFNPNKIEKQNENLVAKRTTPKDKVNPTINNINDSIELIDKNFELPVFVAEKTVYQKKNTVQKEPDTEKINLDHLAIRQLPTNFGTEEIKPISNGNYKQNTIAEKHENDYAFVGFEDMKNPIEPITNVLSNKINTPLDIRSAKPSEKSNGGFYMKVGRFEFSRSKH